MGAFTLKAPFEPAGDQPAAIDKLAASLVAGRRHNVLLGVTGSGKTFTMAHVIARLDRPTLVIAPNKTLAAQLYQAVKIKADAGSHARLPPAGECRQRWGQGFTGVPDGIGS